MPTQGANFFDYWIQIQELTMYYGDKHGEKGLQGFEATMYIAACECLETHYKYQKMQMEKDLFKQPEGNANEDDNESGSPSST